MERGGDVAGREDVVVARAKVVVDGDTVRDGEPGTDGELVARRGADPDHHQIRGDARPAIGHDLLDRGVAVERLDARVRPRA